MAEQSLPGLNREQPYIGSQGNLSVFSKTFTIPATYVLNDTILIARLPQGARIVEVVVVTDGGSTAAAKMSLGLEPVPGGGDTWDSPNVLLTTIDLDTQSIARRTLAAPVVGIDILLESDYYLESKLFGVDIDSDAVVEVNVFYENTGTP